MTEEDLVRLYRRATVSRRDPARDGCVPPEALLAVAEQEGPEDARLESINHAMTCTECGEELELLRATRIVRDRTRMPRAGLALAASLVLVAGLGYYSLARGRPSAAGGDDPTRAGSADVQLIAPADSVAGRLTALVWRPVTGATAYVVEIRRDDGTLLTRAMSTDTMLALPDSVQVTPGSDVYWGVIARLSDGNELRSPARRIRVTP